ncbi:MAG: RimK family protein [Acidobacteria bacterium]|nr:RimK family protein [Acidobacteriota bacterium]
MSQQVLIVQRAGDLKWASAAYRVVTAREYIEQAESFRSKTRVINLHPSYEYMGYGYYCSLLAEARQHRVIPSVRNILELSQKRMYRPYLAELDELLQKKFHRLAEPPEGGFTLYIFFGIADDPTYQQLAHRIFELFRFPILRVQVRRRDTLRLHAIQPVSIENLSQEQDAFFGWALARFTRTTWQDPKVKTAARYSVAILHDPRETLPPSDQRTLQKFVRAGEALNLDVALIQKKDLPRLLEFDALFIRETTAMNHHTYRFAQRAQREGMVVIDDPVSILRCTNKVYLAELLRLNKIPTPRSEVVSRRRLGELSHQLRFPMVLKIPDSSFSRGVFKVETLGELNTIAEKLFHESDLILAQEFMYTPFDWRVGVLNGEPLFVCQYHMARKHWQIINHKSDRERYGKFLTLPVAEAPAEMVDTAVRAARLIGGGLYGVDLKQTEEGVFVIEVNDNPNIDTGVEDQILKDELFARIMREFLRRLEQRSG